MTIRIFERTAIQEFSFSSVASDSTGGGELDLSSGSNQAIHTGILRGVSVSCDSTDFDISIRTKSNAQENTIDEIYSVTNIDTYRSDDDLYQGWVNNDSPISSKLYAVIVNNDLANPTGIIRVRIVTDIHRKYSKYTG